MSLSGLAEEGVFGGGSGGNLYETSEGAGEFYTSGNQGSFDIRIFYMKYQCRGDRWHLHVNLNFKRHCQCT